MRRPYEGLSRFVGARHCLALCRDHARRVLKTRPDVTSPETPYMRVAQSTETANHVSAGKVTALPNTTHALVAQLDRAPDFESGGGGVEAPRAPQKFDCPARTQKRGLGLAKGTPLSVRMTLGNPNCLKTASNTRNA